MTLTIFFSIASILFGLLGVVFLMVHGHYFDQYLQEEDPGPDQIVTIDTTPMAPETPPEPVIPESNPIPMNKNQALYDAAYASLGHDMSPADIAPDTLACAESLNGVFKKAFGENIGTGPALTGTNALYKLLVVDRRFEKTTVPTPGCIVISPTGYSSKGAQHGHCGVWGNHDVMSNESDSGLWTDNFTHEAWYEFFNRKLGFPVFFFDIKG